jgi:hypothetical protein
MLTAMTDTDVQSKLAEYEGIVRMLTAKVEELVAENDRLRAEGGAHTALRSVYNDPQASETNKVKAAAAAIGYEQPKILSVPPAINLDRRERWRIYEQWSLRREIVMKTRDTPPPGWADHLQRDNYVEPPESEGMPPVDVIDTPQGFKILSNLLPKPGSQRKLGNGNGGDDSNKD